ncbi:hypothetical protein DB32_008180 [Sandaracinus amylolyticus]|uniref:Uncharacterized protein n=1 Tax=Sandaracinus amylolyticus TaxID=927083 RepID=A0A0F6W9Q3_9BACT|nr:hypothetical protein DB32_008180 [Sandaracinus amylolyticus]
MPRLQSIARAARTSARDPHWTLRLRAGYDVTHERGARE